MNRSKQGRVWLVGLALASFHLAEAQQPLIAILVLVLASGCVASGASRRYRPCHELRTDMSVSNDEFDWHCPRYPTD
jgi:hypothetical protein